MDLALLGTFTVTELLLVLVPGADWAYAIAAGTSGRVLPAVAGLVCGYAGHTALVATGLGVLVSTTPVALTALTALGAGYLLWLGVRTFTSRGESGAARVPAGAGAAWRGGVAVSELNPKGLLLYLALLPQFVRPGSWPVPAQTVVLGAVHMLTCLLVYLAVATSARVVLAQRPAAASAVRRAAGLSMVLLGGALLVEHFAG